jgi:hypothetical protein
MVNGGTSPGPAAQQEIWKLLEATNAADANAC